MEELERDSMTARTQHVTQHYADRQHDAGWDLLEVEEVVEVVRSGAGLPIVRIPTSAVCSLQCAHYTMQCAVCSVQCAVCSVQCVVCSVLWRVEWSVQQVCDCSGRTTKGWREEY